MSTWGRQITILKGGPRTRSEGGLRFLLVKVDICTRRTRGWSDGESDLRKDIVKGKSRYCFDGFGSYGPVIWVLCLPINIQIMRCPRHVKKVTSIIFRLPFLLKH